MLRTNNSINAKGCAAILCVLITLIFCLIVFDSNSTRAQAGTTRVTVQPASGAYQTGSQFVVQIRVEDVVDLYGADVRLSFDPAKLMVVDPNPGTTKIEITPLSDFMVPGLLVKNEANNTAGTVWYAAAQLLPDPEVSGSGAICSFTLQVLGTGDTDLVVTYRKLSNKSGEEIPADAYGASYILLADVFLPLISR